MLKLVSALNFVFDFESWKSKFTANRLLDNPVSMITYYYIDSSYLISLFNDTLTLIVTIG